MVRMLLTDPAIRKVKAPKKGRLELSDKNVTGLVMRITSKNIRSWGIRYYSGGKQWRYNFGNYPVMSLAQARKEAKKLLARVSLGDNPQKEKLIDRQARPETVGEVVIHFIETYAKPKNRASTVKQAEQALRSLTEKVGKRAISDIAKADIIYLIDRIAAKPNPGINLKFRHWRKFFNWCVDRDLIPVSPMNGLKQPTKNNSRDRVLDEGEIKEVWEAIGKIAYPYRDLYKLLLLTGQRRGEVATMKWADIAGEVWTIPAAIAKNGKIHDVPLSETALEILESIPRQQSQYVFTTTAGRTNERGEDISRPVGSFGKAKARLDAKIAQSRLEKGLGNINHLVIHDFRRTVTTQLAKMSFPVHVIEKTLNHKGGAISGVAAVYNRYDYQDERKAALAAWDRRLKEIITGKEGDNVISFKK